MAIRDRQDAYGMHVVASKNRIGFCVTTLLSWIASSDGEISPEERRGIEAIAEASKHSDELSNAIEFGCNQNSRALQLACEILQLSDADVKKLFLEMCVGIALEDGYLKLPEMHILVFLSDVIGVGVRGLEEVFAEITGDSFPAIGDPSSIGWWQSRERRHGSNAENHNHATEHVDPDRLRLLGILGLDEFASLDDIRTAYRRMVKVHHPDRYVTLGPEAVAAATQTFRRIQAAYERLVNT